MVSFTLPPLILNPNAPALIRLALAASLSRLAPTPAKASRPCMEIENMDASGSVPMVVFPLVKSVVAMFNSNEETLATKKSKAFSAALPLTCNFSALLISRSNSTPPVS